LKAYFEVAIGIDFRCQHALDFDPGFGFQVLGSQGKKWVQVVVCEDDHLIVVCVSLAQLFLGLSWKSASFVAAAAALARVSAPAEPVARRLILPASSAGMDLRRKLALTAAVVGQRRRCVGEDVTEGAGGKGQGATAVVCHSFPLEVPIVEFDPDLRVRSLMVEAVAEDCNHRLGNYMVVSKLGTVANCNLETLDMDKVP
jgi:hypothetical protein